MRDGAIEELLEEREEPGWQRTLTVTAIAQVMTILGFSFVTPFLPLYIQHLGIHGVTVVTFWAAMLSAGTAAGMAIASPIWGVLADRHGRKIMVVRAALSAAVLITFMGFVQNVFELLVLRILQGMFTGTVAASQALVSSQMPRKRLGFGLGVMQTTVFVGNSVGPLTGGLLAATVGFRGSFGIAGVLLGIGGLFVLFGVRERRPVFHSAGVSQRPSFVQGLGTALKAPALLAMVAAIFAVQFAMTVVFPILPQFVQVLEGHAAGTTVVTGLILTCAGAAGAISSLVVGWVSDRVGYRTILAVAALSGAALAIPQFFVTASWQLLALRTLDGFALGGMLPSASALIASLVPAEQRGTAYGLVGTATALGFAAGPLTAAAVVAIAGIRAVFLAAACLLTAVAIWVTYMVRVPSQEAGADTAARTSSEQTA